MKHDIPSNPFLQLLNEGMQLGLSTSALLTYWALRESAIEDEDGKLVVRENQTEFGKRIGQARSTLANHLSELRLPGWIKTDWVKLGGPCTRGRARVCRILLADTDHVFYADRALPKSGAA